MNAVLKDAILYDTLALTPSLMIDFNYINQTFARFEAAFPGAHIDYAMKANANPQVVRRVVELGGGLEIASPAELDRALEAGARGEQIICSNPIKTPAFLRRLEAAGAFAVVVDSVEEVEKVAQHMPGGRVYIRLAVDNTGSVLPLAGK
jgi:ornithine decarboxylase